MFLKVNFNVGSEGTLILLLSTQTISYILMLAVISLYVIYVLSVINVSIFNDYAYMQINI